MNKIIQENIPQIRALLIENKVERAYLFGSNAINKDTTTSDIDFLIKFKEEIDFVEYGNNYFNLMYQLQELLKKEIDLVAEETIQNKYLKQSIDANKIQIL